MLHTVCVPILLLTIITALGTSLLTKVLADQFLKERIAVIGEFAGLRYALNPGVAFSLDLGQFQTVIILGALIAISVVAFRTAKTRWSQIGYGLIVGGALGNVIDRLFDGYVTDFFQVGTFPIFNLADSWITVGVGILLIETLFFARKKSH